MHQYVFSHVDLAGNLWRHVHFVKETAEAARQWWAKRKVVLHCSHRITTMPRVFKKPCIFGVNIQSVIDLEE